MRQREAGRNARSAGAVLPAGGRLLFRFVVTCALVAGTTASASAEGGAPPLYLGVFKQARAQAALTEALATHLQHQDMETSFIRQKSRCITSVCLEALLAAHPPADVVIWMDVQEERPGWFAVYASLFPAHAAAPLQKIGSTEDPAELNYVIGQTMDGLIGSYRHPPPRARPASGTVTAVAPGRSSRDASSAAPAWDLRARRGRIAAIVLGSLALGSLAAAITLTALDGRCQGPCNPSNPPRDGVLDNVVPYSIGYAAAGGLALSAGLTLALTHPRRDREIRGEVH